MTEKKIEHNADCASQAHDKHLCFLMYEGYILITPAIIRRSSKMLNSGVKTAAEQLIEVIRCANRLRYDMRVPRSLALFINPGYDAFYSFPS